MSAKRSERNRKVRQVRNAIARVDPHVIYDGKGNIQRGAGRNNFTYGPNRHLEVLQKYAANRRRAEREAKESAGE